MSDGVTFSESSAARIARAIRRSERQPPGPPDDGTSSSGGMSPYLLEARVTGEAENAEAEDKGDCDYLVFPAVLLVWDNDNACWTDGDPIWLFDLNGGSLTTDVRYPVKLLESHATVIDGDEEDIRPLAYVVGGGASGPGLIIRYLLKACVVNPP